MGKRKKRKQNKERRHTDTYGHIQEWEDMYRELNWECAIHAYAELKHEMIINLI
jgi:hypothetical protein